jgi:molybdate transport system regulatory protein
MKVRAKFWVENRGEVVVGAGKAALLLAVDQLGSIQRASDQFGMSYRHAWGAIRRIEQRAGFKLVETTLGGKDRGGARLTKRGRIFIEKVDALFRDLHETVETKINERGKRR